MNGMTILGHGVGLPKDVMTNLDLEKMVETSDAWISEMTGIKKRYMSRQEETSDLGTKAAREAIRNAGLDKEEIDLIITATSTPEQYFPSVSCLIHEKLGIQKDIQCFDLSAACTGFVYALDTAMRFLYTDSAIQNVLIIGVDHLSKITDFTDRNTCVLFGDGAGAVIIKADEKKSYVSYLKSNGKNASFLFCDACKVQEAIPYIHMNGREVFKFACRVMMETILNLLERSNLEREDIKYIIPHQANYRIIEYVAEKLSIPISDFYVNIADYGNTSAASIPIALYEMDQKKLVKPHDKVLLVGFGAGFTWGGMIIEI